MQTYLVADGEVKEINLKTKRLTLSVKKLLFRDVDYTSAVEKELLADVSIAAVMSDTGATSLSAIKKGMHVTAVSRAEVLKKIMAEKTDSLNVVLDKLPIPVPIDELKIITKDDTKKIQDKKNEEKKDPVQWLAIAKIGLGIAASIIIILLLMPSFIWLYFNARAKGEKTSQAYERHRASLYYLNQLGYPINDNSPDEFSYFIDRQFGTSFNLFSRVYQKTKYSKTALNDDELLELNKFYDPFIQKIKEQVSFTKRLSCFFNLTHTINYFSKPKTR